MKHICRILTLHVSLLLSLSTWSACSDDGGISPRPDASIPDATMPDAMVAPDAMPLQGIEGARGAPDGAVLADLQEVLITYLKPGFGDEPAGFFVQTESAGPALFIAVDPASLSPSPAVGDKVSFLITEMQTASGMRQASAIEKLTIIDSDNALDSLVQPLPDGAAVVSAIDDYEGEIVSVELDVSGAFEAAGNAHTAAAITPIGASADEKLRLRLPDAVQDIAGLEDTCTLGITTNPLWRLDDIAYVSAWRFEELAGVACPAPRLVNAEAISDTQLRLEFNRGMDSASITDVATQFTFDNGLTATAAEVEGRSVILTTSEQTEGQRYTVTVADTVLDVFDAGVDAATNSDAFVGFQILAGIRINEVKANIDPGCDLIELRVLSDGSLTGVIVRELNRAILTFPEFQVTKNDIIVIHTNKDSTTCNPGSSADETGATDEQPQAAFSANFDTAFDWYSTDTELAATTNVLTLQNAAGTILDAVLLTDGSSSPTNAAESQASLLASVEEWQVVGGGVPPSGFADEAFHEHAAPGLADDPADVSAGFASLEGKQSIQRNDDADQNDRADWTLSVHSLGTLNADQNLTP